MSHFDGQVYDIDFIRKLNDTQFGVRTIGGNDAQAFFSTDFRFQVILASALVTQTPVTIEYEEIDHKKRISSVTIRSSAPIDSKLEIGARIETDSNGNSTRAKLHID
ncbi:hypothetical protein [Rhizobium sp. RAF56]|uniref:hypothetical protein n=1 Tax=Rhizobium sp. RAF56 TaxID=3233062 RepID=UPI003F982FF3